MAAYSKLQTRFIAMASPLALVAGLAVAPQSIAADKTYAADSAGDMVTTGYGECWQIESGTPGPKAECGDVVEADAGPLDSDGDGVDDSMDKCPDTPAGAVVDADGCPVDSDGDGVPDYADKCPGTKAGATVDASGCEVIEAVVIDSVQADFDFDSAALKSDMKSALDEVVSKVKASRADEMLSVTGHTDSIGTDAYNQGLSERRAKSVADYLSAQGLDAGRMTVSGAGESQPVADNTTEAGRSKNRRVEIRSK